MNKSVSAQAAIQLLTGLQKDLILKAQLLIVNVNANSKDEGKNKKQNMIDILYDCYNLHLLYKNIKFITYCKRKNTRKKTTKGRRQNYNNKKKKAKKRKKEKQNEHENDSQILFIMLDICYVYIK